ncbi:hypothetical protein K488DRAFT_92804, partial [Vararia minispora EC-137]
MSKVLARLEQLELQQREDHRQLQSAGFTLATLQSELRRLASPTSAAPAHVSTHAPKRARDAASPAGSDTPVRKKAVVTGPSASRSVPVHAGGGTAAPSATSSNVRETSSFSANWVGPVPGPSPEFSSQDIQEIAEAWTSPTPGHYTPPRTIDRNREVSRDPTSGRGRGISRGRGGSYRGRGRAHTGFWPTPAYRPDATPTPPETTMLQHADSQRLLPEWGRTDLALYRTWADSIPPTERAKYGLVGYGQHNQYVRTSTIRFVMLLRSLVGQHAISRFAVAYAFLHAPAYRTHVEQHGVSQCPVYNTRGNPSDTASLSTTFRFLSASGVEPVELQDCWLGAST